MSVTNRLKNAWSAFREDSDSFEHSWSMFNKNDPFMVMPKARPWYGGTNYNPTATKLRLGSERSILNFIITRIAIDAAAIDVIHARLDQNGRFLEKIDSDLNECLTISANLDQTGRAFIQDAVMSMCDEGCIAIVPVESDFDPDKAGSFKIYSLRVGKITQWFPEQVQVSLYNEKIGQRQEVIVAKKNTAIVENPFYSVMNEPNSKLRRLVQKMSLADKLDNDIGSGKLDLIIQLPYTIRSDKRREQAEARRKDIEMQLAGSKYGIAYADGMEKVVQLNRPLENNLASQITDLSKQVYEDFGITQGIMDGTADEATTLNYYNRTIEPILSAITEEMKRKFLTKTARTQGQSIIFVRNPFKLVPVDKIAEIADKFTRNEILSSNEIRSIVGFKPIDNPRADELRNKNLNQNNEEMQEEPVTTAEQGTQNIQDLIRFE